MWINGHRENALNDEENRRKQIKAIRKCSTRRSTRCTGAVKKTVAMSQRRRMEHQPIITITIIIAWDKKKRKKKQYRATNSNIGCRTPQNGMREGVINHQNGGHVDLIGHQWESGQDFSIAKQNVPHIWCRPYAAKFRLWGRTTMVMECYRRAKTGTDRRHLSQNRVCGWWAWRL